MSNALEFSAVGKTFGKAAKQIVALSDIHFTVAEGEVFGFVGPNGAGKTTTIKSMLDIINDYDGSIQIFGVSAREASARQGVAYVPESPALYEQFTPLDILRMAMRMYGIRRPDADAWCQRWLDRFSVGHVAHRRMRLLSKGTFQRVALAHAMVVSPRLLVLDEPLSGLDPIGRADVVDILAEYKRDGGTIFFTSHVLHDVERIADRFGLIHKGVLRTVQQPNELTGNDEVLLVRSQGETAIQGMKSDGAGRWHIECSRHALWSMLGQLQNASHEIIEIKPILNLETAFLKYVKLDGQNIDVSH
jgi:ABC-2 type transport system ATP-binding protein